jgi:hypothetical protein
LFFYSTSLCHSLVLSEQLRQSAKVIAEQTTRL